MLVPSIPQFTVQNFKTKKSKCQTPISINNNTRPIAPSPTISSSERSERKSNSPRVSPSQQCISRGYASDNARNVSRFLRDDFYSAGVREFPPAARRDQRFVPAIGEASRRSARRPGTEFQPPKAARGAFARVHRAGIPRVSSPLRIPHPVCPPFSKPPRSRSWKPVPPPGRSRRDAIAPREIDRRKD